MVYKQPQIEKDNIMSLIVFFDSFIMFSTSQLKRLISEPKEIKIHYKLFDIPYYNSNILFIIV